MLLNIIIRSMIFFGVGLMVYNIISYVRYARSIQGQKNWGKESRVLRIPIFLLVMFLLGYIAVGLIGSPDLIIAGILFGGSIFVFIIFWVLQRITFRIQENERLEARALAAEQSSRAKSTFLASMSHEMRTPMNAILGLDNLVLKDPSLQSESRRRLEQIGANARHMLDLIDDVLSMREAHEEQVALMCEPFSLRQLMQELDGMISVQCAEKGLRYESRVDVAADMRYCGDVRRLRRALLILLDNAVKFTEKGYVFVHVYELDGEGDKHRLRFEVQDSGIGIDEDYLPRLFQLFSQEDASNTNRFGGSGLGLALARRIAELMDGTLTVESEKGKGSTFVLAVCLDPAPAEESVLTAGEGFGLEGRRVLIVEDVDFNAEILADLLELEGVASDRAQNGQVALDMFSAGEPDSYDAILMDLRMPVMDGFTAAERIRAMDRPDAKTVPIIALTANAFQEDVDHCLAVGMNEHLAKPAEPEILYASLARWIRLREKQ